MLKKIPKSITPDLMYALMSMGHGDEIVFGDANFPSVSMNENVIRADAQSITELLTCILPYFPLDSFVKDNVILMGISDENSFEPKVWEEYRDIITCFDEEKAFTSFKYIDRFEFYERAKKAFVIVATGEKEKYSNIILKLGVVI